MTRLNRIIIGIILLIVSIVLLNVGVIWYFSLGGTVFMILWAVFGDTSTPENNPKAIKQYLKKQFSVGHQKTSEIIQTLHELKDPWKSKNSPNKLLQKMQSMKNMTTASITYTYGASLITRIKLSVKQNQKIHSWSQLSVKAKKVSNS